MMGQGVQGFGMDMRVRGPAVCEQAPLHPLLPGPPSNLHKRLLRRRCRAQHARRHLCKLLQYSCRSRLRAGQCVA